METYLEIVSIQNAVDIGKNKNTSLLNFLLLLLLSSLYFLVLFFRLYIIYCFFLISLSLSCSCFGCARGAKQDSVNTFLADACSTGTTKIITGAWVESIILEKTKKNSDARNKGRFKQAVGVVVKVGPACSPLKISFSAPIVICCAGAIQTPAVMLRSNIFSGGNVGANLRLHPCTCVVGIFPPEVKISAYLGEDGCSSGSGSGFCGATPSGSIR